MSARVSTASASEQAMARSPIMVRLRSATNWLSGLGREERALNPFLAVRTKAPAQEQPSQE